MLRGKVPAPLAEGEDRPGEQEEPEEHDPPTSALTPLRGSMKGGELAA